MTVLHPLPADATTATVVERVAGSDRYATAAAISRTAFPSGATTAFVASGENFPDALTAAPLAINRGPVLLVRASTIPDATAGELRRLGVSGIVIVGGPASVSEAVARELRVYSAGDVTRVAGADRFATAAAASRSRFAPGVPVVYIANGLHFADAMTVAAATNGNGPLLLVAHDGVPQSTADEIRRLSPQRVVVVGGTGIVSAAVASTVDSLTSASVTRVAGADRYATAAAVSRAVFGAPVPLAIVATGSKYADALAAGAGTRGAGPVLVTLRDSLPGSVADELRRLRPQRVIVVGGTGAVADSVLLQIQGLIANASISPSGQGAPIGDLPSWDQVFVDDFNTNVALGDFPNAVSDRWSAYPSPWRDNKGGLYAPHKTVSVAGGILDVRLHTENGESLAAALLPQLPAGQDQLYGRYAIRFRADPVPGYKTAWLLWPQSGQWPADGEIDFPEGELTGTMKAVMHRDGASDGSDQDVYRTDATYPTWHTAVIEWSPMNCTFILDGVVIGRSTSRVPDSPMHFVIQTERASHTEPPPPNAAGDVQIDWVAIWRYAP